MNKMIRIFEYAAACILFSAAIGLVLIYEVYFIRVYEALELELLWKR